MKNRYTRTNLFVVILVLIISLSLLVFFLFQITSISVIESPIEGETINLVQKVEIYKNRYGIPHIVSDDLYDGMFGVGFAQASDRLWQMDYLRRVASGELSEVLGPEAVKFDQYFRALQLKKSSELILKNLDTVSLRILVSFSNGVNYYIDKFSNKLPVEFQALNYKPKPWTPLDCILIGRLMAFTMNFSFWLDLTYFDIYNRLGLTKTIALLPNKVDNIDFFLHDTLTNFKKTDTSRINLQNGSHNFSHFLEYISFYYPYFSFGSGSNTWAVQVIADTKKTSILASDPHLKLSLPPFWYQIHISTPKVNVVGLCLPGIPLPLIGRNDYIAWGITNGMIDDCDFFVHRIDSTGKFALDSTSKVRINFKPDTIKVRTSPNIVYYQRYIGNDIIVSDFLILKHDSTSEKFYGIKGSPHYPNSIGLTFKWTGFAITNEVRGLYQICTAKNWDEFIEAKKYWGTPVLNFSYADRNGNIGLMLTGVVPIRNHNNPNLPTFASSNSNWLGYQRLGNEFNIFNPKEGFVFNANNKTFNSNIYLSNYWSDPSRAFRIHSLLKQNVPTDVLGMEVIQKDRYSTQAEFVLRKIVPILEKHKAYLNKSEKEAIEKLKSWNCIFSESFVAPSIYQIFTVKFLENTLKDELGEPLLKQYLYLDFIPARKFLEFMSDTSNIFFDNISTNQVENKEEIIIKSFKDAISQLQKLFSTDDVSQWKYGKWHKLKLEHPFSTIEFLDPSFSLDEVPIGGNNSTINYSGSKLFSPEKVEVGPSARFIADLSDSVVYMILPGGNSGQNISRNYSDQFQLWQSGGYISIPLSRQPDSRFRLFAKITRAK